MVLTGDPAADTGSRPRRPGRPDPTDPPAVRRGPAARAAWIVVAAVVALALIRSLLVQSFVVPTASMQPTVQAGDRVLVSRIAYRTGEIKRGDVIVFDGSGVFAPDLTPARSGLASIGRAVASAFSLPVGSQDYLKRVIGLPGDRVICCDARGGITVNGVAVTEPYLNPGDDQRDVPYDIVVPAGRLWVLGDHRADSADSRSHLGDPGGGTVPVGRVVGRVVGVYWPLSHAGGIAGTAAPGEAGATGGAQPSIGKDQR